MENNIKKIISELNGIYPDTEVRSFSYLIIEKLTGLKRVEIILNKNTLFSEEQSQFVDNIIKRLKNYEPIQYILGHTEFYGLPFIVNNSVLIPRPETEELVEWILVESQKKEPLKILDIGTGSGCIAISLKHNLSNAKVMGFDISESALEIAQLNAIKNRVEVDFLIVDILKPHTNEQKWDVIVSNPPYIAESEKSQIHLNVLDFEPHLALFVPDNDPLVFYRHIASYGKKHLNENGKLYFEIHRDTAQNGAKLLEEMGFNDVEIRSDISGNERMISACL